MEWKTKFEERLDILQTKIRKLEREKEDIDTKSPFLEQTIKDSIWEISKLQTEAEVDTRQCLKIHLAMQVVILILSHFFLLQAHMSLKNDRDSSIQNIFMKHNFGTLPKPPFSDEIASNLTNRIKSKLMDLEKDLQDKKVTHISSKR